MKNKLPFLSGSIVKKQLAIVALLVGGSFTEVMGQAGYDYRSQKTGGTWSNYSTWQRREVGTTDWVGLSLNQPVPDYTANSITISSGTTVTITGHVLADQVTVANGATLTINFPYSLTVNDDAGTDLQVDGTIIAKGRGDNSFGNIERNGSNASIVFSATGVYKHNYESNPSNANKTAWGILPVATWDPASTVEINVAGTEMNTASIPATTNFNQAFGNLKWYTPNLGADNISMNSLLENIQGNFEVISTGLSQLVLTPTNNYNYFLSVGKDFKVLNDSKVVFAAGNSTTPSAAFSLNIGGSFEVASGAKFTNSRASFPVDITFTGTGTINSVNTIGNMNFNVAQSGNMTLLSNFAVPGNQTVPATFNVSGRLNTGTYNINGNGTFNLQSGATLGIGSAVGLNASTGSIRTATRNLNSDATYIYNGTSSQTTGAELPLTVSGLIIDNTGTVNTVELTNSVSVTKKFTLQNGVLSPKNKTFKLIESPALVVTAINNSYVDGAINYEVSTAGSKTMLFPIGKNAIARPITLTLDQATGVNNYIASQTESALNVPASKMPTGLDAVSSKRYFTISQSGTGAVTNAFVKLTYNADEVVADKEMRIIKSEGASGWMNLGGTLTANSTVTSTNAFSTFSQFAVAYKTINPLPVELVAFKAVKAENAVNVTWATASEKNNAYFSVERSADGKNFTAIGQVEGAGTTSLAKQYAFADKNPLSNVSYYRLKQVDFDGAAEFSQIVKVVNTKGPTASVNAFPNPTTALVNIEIGGLNEAATLQVIDLTGRVVAEQILAKDATKAQVNLASQPAGVYQVKLVSANGMTVLKVVKN